MKIARLLNGLSTTVVFIVMLSFTLPLRGYVIKKDNPQLTQLLADADDEAIKLANDADDTQGLIRSDENWVDHALMLAQVKGHVDNLALIIAKLSDMEKSGSDLQEQAIDQMLPLVKELSANTTAAINYLNQNKSRPTSSVYTQYLKENAEAAHQLSSMISSLVDYEKSMTEIERLRSSLGGSGD
jgi:hypothetical protein